MARAIERGRGISDGLRFVHAQGDGPDGRQVAEALARFLVARCEGRHAGWRTLRGVIIAAGAQPPWERCARRAVGPVAEDLLEIAAGESGRPPLARVQHVAAGRRAEQLAPYADPAAVLDELGLAPRDVSRERWAAALRAAVTARSREQVARALEEALPG